MSLCKWKPGFDASVDLGKVAPTWVGLPGLPLEFWHQKVFKGIADSFGSLVTIDKFTLLKTRLVYARICVNVAVNTVLPTLVTLKSKFGKWVQPLEYERAMVFRQGCNKFGHLQDACKIVPLETKIPQIETQVNDLLKNKTLLNSPKESEISTPNKKVVNHRKSL